MMCAKGTISTQTFYLTNISIPIAHCGDSHFLIIYPQSGISILVQQSFLCWYDPRVRGYPAKRALPAMLTHGRKGPFGRIPVLVQPFSFWRQSWRRRRWHETDHPTGTIFAKVYEHMTEILWKLFVLTIIQMIQSGHKFACATTVQLSCQVQIHDQIWLLFFKWEQYWFLQDLDYELLVKWVQDTQMM